MNPEKLKVSSSGIVRLQDIGDKPDGILHIGEVGKNIPIEIKRFYFIDGLEYCKSQRGAHAHRELTQIIFCAKGSFELDLDDGKAKESLMLDDLSTGVILGPLLWHNMKNFSDNCLLFIVASDLYKESDYIRDYQEFSRIVKRKSPDL